MRIALVVACLALPAFSAASAHAAFPGANGKIAFSSDRDGNFEIYTMNPDGTGQTRITSNTATDVSPAWSADGTKIAFASNRDGNFEIYKMNADGTGLVRLTNIMPPDDVQPAWSPDGTKIAFTTNRDGNFEIWTMNSADGTGLTRITNNPASDSQPAWSPDGTKIAFTTNRDGNFEIYTMNTNGTSLTRITNNSNDEMEPNWSPDGVNIAFQLPFDATTDVVASKHASGGGDYRFFTETLFGYLEREPAWSPDNTKVAFALKPAGSGDWDIASVLTVGTSSLTPLAASVAAEQSPDWQPVLSNYARPRSATPIRLALVPAYKQCGGQASATVPNSKHKGALTTASCNPPKPESSYLTVGTPDFNGPAANAAGYVAMKVFCNGGASGEAPPCLTTAGDQLDIRVTVSQTDVRCQGTSGNCAGGPLSDYAGNLMVMFLARVTDRNSGGASGVATIQDFTFGHAVSCATTGSGTIGSTCSSTTSFDALLGGASVITEGKRAIWDLDDIKIFDGGADGFASTMGDNTLFAVDGLFAP